MKIKFLLWYVFFSLWLMGCKDAESAIDYKQNVSVRLSMDAATTRGVSHFRQSTDIICVMFWEL